jgi:hypothetical protein
MALPDETREVFVCTTGIALVCGISSIFPKTSLGLWESKRQI